MSRLNTARWKVHGRLSIRVNWFFAIYCGSRVIRKNVYSSAVFARGRPLCTQILGQCRPLSTIFGIRKLETLRYPSMKTASLRVPSFWHNTRVWRTDEQTDGRICRSTALAKLDLLRCKMISGSWDFDFFYLVFTPFRPDPLGLWIPDPIPASFVLNFLICQQNYFITVPSAARLRTAICIVRDTACISPTAAPHDVWAFCCDLNKPGLAYKLYTASQNYNATLLLFFLYFDK